MSSRIINADCREAMREMAADSIDSIVCDPPYGLSFMGKGWDHGVPSVPFWAEALRVLKPGAHLLAFGGTRTFHRLTCAIEDAGFEVRDCVMWVYGSGFPKSLDVSKAIDAQALTGKSHSRDIRAAIAARDGETRATSTLPNNGIVSGDRRGGTTNDNPTTDAARQWAGWGTALKPAWEPIIVARKPLRGTVAANVQQFGTGALNIDGCRIGIDEADRATIDERSGAGFGTIQCAHAGRNTGEKFTSHTLGRWPANVIHDGSDEVVALFPETTSGDWNGQPSPRGFNGCGGGKPMFWQGDTGSAARFFYTAKASAADRNDGLYRHRPQFAPTMGNGIGGKEHDPQTATRKHNIHPTVKPTDLMRYLCRLVTPPGGTVLDPFCGSGSTGKAALLEGFDFIGIEIDPEYAAIASDRVYSAAPLFAGAAD